MSQGNPLILSNLDYGGDQMPSICILEISLRWPANIWRLFNQHRSLQIMIKILFQVRNLLSKSYNPGEFPFFSSVLCIWVFLGLLPLCDLGNTAAGTSITDHISKWRVVIKGGWQA